MMDLLLSYSIEDFVLFNHSAYLRALSQINAQIWPLQWVGIVGFLLLWWHRDFASSTKALFVFLGFSWFGLSYYYSVLKNLDIGAQYLLKFSILQGLLMLAFAFRVRGWGDVKLKNKIVSCLCFALALGISLWTLWINWMHSSVVGFSPMPTALATLGAALLCKRRGLLLLIGPFISVGHAFLHGYVFGSALQLGLGGSFGLLSLIGIFFAYTDPF